MKKSFRIYPLKECHFYKKNKGNYYDCHLFSTRDEMYKWNSKDGYEEDGGYEAVTRSFDVLVFKGKKEKKSPKIGSISFHMDRIGSGIVSHEFTHAALYWIITEFGSPAKLKNKLVDEAMAWVQGNMVRQFWVNWEKLEKKGFIKK